MKYLDTYLQHLRDKGNEPLADSVKKTASEVSTKLKSFSFITHEIGILFGNVQSGKTSQVFGIISEAADLGFPIFILLTTDNVALQQQTLERVQEDLSGYLICGENDSKLFADNNLQDPAVIVLKKNSRVLKQWLNVLKSTGFARGNPIFIIDDEADAASLNTRVNSNAVSSINRYLSEIRKEGMSSFYLQVTGTPQALFLQTLQSNWKPMFSYYFDPGIGYLGGDFFFPSTGKPECITFLDKKKDNMEDIVLRHLVVSAQLMLSGKTVSNSLFHPGVRVSSHKKILKSIEEALQNLKQDEDLESKIKEVCDLIHPEKTPKQSFEDISKFVMEVLQENRYKTIEMNGQNDVPGPMYSSGINFISGGNTLGRGVTFPALNTIYYTRTAKNPQADTMWQHSRMFGYDRDPGLMMVYMDEMLYKLFSDINATNNSIIAQIKNGADQIKIYYPKNISPTRKNVLDNKAVFSISGGVNYYPFNPDNPKIEELDSLLNRFGPEKEYYSVNLRLIRQLLSLIDYSEDFHYGSIDAVLEAILAEKPNAQGILIVRKGRHVSQGTGALLSSSDFQLSSSFKDQTVLTIYENSGKLGWKKDRLWIPNIKLPGNALFYEVMD